MSIVAFCASRVSWISTGSARTLICWSLPLPLGYWTTETSVIEPSATVNSTWTGPQRVAAVSPVTVLDPVDADGPEVASGVLCTGATAEDWPPAAAWDDVDVW